MHVIVLKYVQVLCITIFFSNNVNCDKLLLHNEREDQDLYRIGACTAACMTGTVDAHAGPADDEPKLKNLEQCYRQCSEDTRPLSAWKPLTQRRDSSLRIHLICRDSTNLIIRVQHDTATGNDLRPTGDHKSSRTGKSSKPSKAIDGERNQLNGLPGTSDDASLSGEPFGSMSSSVAPVALGTHDRPRRAIGSNSIPPSELYTDRGTDIGHNAESTAPLAIYLVKVQESEKELGDRIVYMSNASLVKIENLNPNKRYNITATVLTSEYEYFYVEKVQFRTLPVDYLPGTIVDVKVEKFSTNSKKPQLVDAVISWRPATDKTCHYEILCHPTHSSEFHHEAVDVQQPEVLYKYTMKQLDLNANYMVAIRSKNTQNSQRESQLHWHSFYTPSCAVQQNGSQICAAEPIENLRVMETLLTGDLYKINITWDRPSISPDFYMVRVYDLHGSHLDNTSNSLSKNVSGKALGLMVDSFEMFGPHFEVNVVAYSSGGTSSENVIKPLAIKRVTPDSWIWTKLVFIILSPVLMIGLLKISVSLVCRRRAKLKRNVERCEYFKDLEQKAPVDPSTEFETKAKNIQDLLSNSPFPPELMVPINDELEIDGEHLILHDLLGEGAFGLVRKGTLHPPEQSPRPVAVKMLKECPRVEDIIEFRREMEVMKSVGTHPHIVSIVGHCTKNVRKMMLLTEYCGHGNLLNYLRFQWQRLLKQNRSQRTVSRTSTVPAGLDRMDTIMLPVAGECLTPALGSGKKPENVFNFDTSFVNDKKSMTYKNLSDEQLRKPTGKRPQIFENKLYPLLNDDDDIDKDEEPTGRQRFCTNACKNVVEIMDAHAVTGGVADEEGMEMKGHVKIKPCSCQSVARERERESSTQNSIENRCYHRCPDEEEGERQDIVEEESTPTSEQLLEFSRQIALGMEYLARNKVVHRDLAARNVLVCSNSTVKIADFGLSRDIYQENLYRKTSNGKLPIKWLALESMTHQVYTSQSDVWAYGILLYEICTLGGSPYPSISTNKLLRYLESGYRMERPKSCSEEFYNLMYSCWNLHPGERPTFTKIVHMIEQLQQGAGEMQEPVAPIIDLNAIIDLHCAKGSTEENSYLKPVEY
ncbi:tyrosine-protein kinase receptor torso [Anopheles aquasalis]|uniref:tyrosine-protein kinase receptor torso n=1 Tax=Anopheles aquasalis TaxID=42839 RepID=UPI00215B1E13|nr:tyrosine-protein kinase receptor torso [Anopheles aquasalis]